MGLGMVKIKSQPWETGIYLCELEASSIIKFQVSLSYTLRPCLKQDEMVKSKIRS